MKRIGVKYCGGCREQYDRKAEFERIRKELSNEEVEFVTVRDGGSYDELLVLCGCPAKCADVSGYDVRGSIVTVDSEGEGVIALADHLAEV